jgi:hypothetical protein
MIYFNMVTFFLNKDKVFMAYSTRPLRSDVRDQVKIEIGSSVYLWAEGNKGQKGESQLFNKAN